MIVSFFQYKLTAIYIILWSMYTKDVCDPKGYQRSLWIRLYSDWMYRSSGEYITVNAIHPFSVNIARYFVCTPQSYDDPINNMKLP